MGYIVNSAIADPIHQETITVPRDDPFITLRGYALGNQAKGTAVERVELSFNGGKTWTKSTIIMKEEKNPSLRVYSWVIWEHRINVLDYISKDNVVKVTVKATDTEGTTKDKTLEEINNLKGLLNNSPHTIEFTVNIKG